jgi:hypothetical protein
MSTSIINIQSSIGEIMRRKRANSDTDMSYNGYQSLYRMLKHVYRLEESATIDVMIYMLNNRSFPLGSEHHPSEVEGFIRYLTEEMDGIAVNELLEDLVPQFKEDYDSDY